MYYINPITHPWLILGWSLTCDNRYRLWRANLRRTAILCFPTLWPRKILKSSNNVCRHSLKILSSLKSTQSSLQKSKWYISFHKPCMVPEEKCFIQFVSTHVTDKDKQLLSGKWRQDQILLRGGSLHWIRRLETRQEAFHQQIGTWWSAVPSFPSCSSSLRYYCWMIVLILLRTTAMHDLDPVFSKFSRKPVYEKLAREVLGFKNPLLLQSMFIFKVILLSLSLSLSLFHTPTHTRQRDERNTKERINYTFEWTKILLTVRKYFTMVRHASNLE